MAFESGKIRRRTFLGAMTAWSGQALLDAAGVSAGEQQKKPNIVFVFGDQWRAQATGYNGDPNAHTPNLDRLAREGVDFTHAVSGCPVCSPYRASLLTGQYWLTHGVFLNDVPLSGEATTMAEALAGAGYRTAYIGKWHLDGHGRLSYIPAERRQGFEYWKVMECTHDYNASGYYDDDAARKTWEGYDAEAQTREALKYIGQRDADRPFAVFLSWGPPHNPYETAPGEYLDRIREEDIVLRDNVPAECAAKARKDLRGYYAHIMALDECVGRLLEALDDAGIADDTIFVFTSDHGDMLYSQGQIRKQRPYDESIRVPFLLRYPAGLGREGRRVDWPINAPDIMPTLLGLSGLEIPTGVEGEDFSGALRGGNPPRVEGALLACVAPFGEWTREHGGREYRGVRTQRHTYVRDRKGPWLLFDNEADPYQTRNLCGTPEGAEIQADLDKMLARILERRGDTFEPGEVYIRQRGYTVDASGTVPIRQ